MTTLRKSVLAAALVALGLLAAAMIARPAEAWYPGDLARLGYSTTVITLLDGCHSYSATGYGATANLGSDCDPGFQARLDAFIDSTCPCVQTTTATVTTPAGTTTTETTVTIPPVATDATATTSPEVIDATPPATTTTATETVTTTVTVDQSAQIAEIQARLDALDARVLVLENGVVNGTPDGYAPAGVTYS